MAGIVLGKVNTATRLHSIGDVWEVSIDGTLDSSYPTGGYALTPTTLGVADELHSVVAHGSDGHTYGYDYANQKLKVFSGGSEVTLSTDLHTVSCRITARGKGIRKF